MARKRVEKQHRIALLCIQLAVGLIGDHSVVQLPAPIKGEWLLRCCQREELSLRFANAVA